MVSSRVGNTISQSGTEGWHVHLGRADDEGRSGTNWVGTEETG